MGFQLRSISKDIPFLYYINISKVPLQIVYTFKLVKLYWWYVKLQTPGQLNFLHYLCIQIRKQNKSTVIKHTILFYTTQINISVRKYQTNRQTMVM